MAGTNSDYTEDGLVDHILGTTELTFVAQNYLAVFTANPNFETGAGGTEATGGGYVRKAIDFDASVSGASASTSDITWTVGTDIAADTYTGWAVYDASAAGNMLFGDAFAASKVLTGARTSCALLAMSSKPS